MRSLYLAAATLLCAAPAFAARPTAGSVTPERLKLPSGPSSVRGLADDPAVDAFLAQLQYTVPIELPEGYGGLAPSLALDYSGALGNGPLGIGWTLAAPQIRRSTRLGVPHFDDTDTLEISGIASGRLVAIGGGEYRVEGKGQTVRIRASGAGWEVDDGKGNHYTLGVTAAGRQDKDATHTLAWRVEDETNSMGERIRYTYVHDRGQIYLSHVAWGPGDVYGVDLTYEPRSDTTTSYRTGFRVDTAQRLAAIHVTAFGTERRAYRMTYDATFPVARLAAVSSTGVAGAGAWPTLTFEYAQPAAPAITPIAGIGNWRLNTSGTTLVDLDGDGAADLLQLSSGGHSYLTNQNGAFGGLQPLGGNAQAIAAVQLHDVDGDGRAELLQDTGNGWAVYKFTRTSWVSQAASLPNGVWPGSPGLALKQPTSTRFADLNGDGLVDVIQWDNDNLKIHLATRTQIAAAYNVPRIGGSVLPTALGRFHDVNGDGLDDYIVTGIDRLDVYIGHGDGTFEPAVPVAYPFIGTITSSDEIELADLDRDGLVDLMRIELGTVRWFRGRPDGTFATTAVTLANPEPLTGAVVVAIADVNGNGSQDVVWSSSSGMWRMDMAGATTAGMLTRVQNGLGMDVTFQYRSSHALAVEAALAGTPWGQTIPIAMPVPVQKTTALGPGETTRQISYSVRDASWDAVEQQFGGFLSTIVTTWGATPAETSSVITRYNAGIGANRELRGKPLSIQVKDGTGTRLSIEMTTWVAMPIAGLPDVPLLRRAVMREKITQHEDTTPARKLDVTYDYDPLGREIRATDSGRLDLTGDESIKLTQYADDDALWIRDKVCEETITDLGGTVLGDTQFLFGDDVAVQPLCAAGKGWPRETRKWLANETRWVSTERTSYDAHGNPTTLFERGVTRQLAYDPAGLFTIEERLTGADRDLVWRGTWDTTLGELATLTDPDGHVTHVTYDSLGRTTGTSIDDRPPHQAMEYDWTAPYPKTYVWSFDGALADVTPKPATWDASSHWREVVEIANGKGEVRYRAARLDPARWIIADYRERDPNSHVVFAGRPVYATELELAGRPAGIAGDTLVYDPLGRVIDQRLANGTHRTFSYTAFERTMQNADLAPVHSVLDGQGRPILTERSLPDGTHDIVQASYDAAGRLTRMTLAGGTVQRDFAYDTLGRLVVSHDPDLGARTLSWDDGDRLVTETNATGQTIHYTYDAAGRLATRDGSGLVTYHYDTARPGTTGTNLGGRLAWTEEPTGLSDTSYDELGHLSFGRHRIDDRTSEVTITTSATGLVLARSFDDGFAVSYSYDPAGRMVAAGDLWHLIDQDASGLALHEAAQNGADTVIARDVLGLPSRITVRDVAGIPIYDATATRDLASNIIAITDSDGIGLDHTQTFSYDGFDRLTGATVGSGAEALTFGYGYDALHNMTARTQAGPRVIGAFTGSYRYGEAGHAPRQLTSIVDGAGTVLHHFDYDAAGRQTASDGLSLTFDAADRVTSVAGVAGGTERHAYGATGDRVKTTAPDGSVTYLFGDGTSERAGVREHDVLVGNRVVARVAVSPTAPGSGVAAAGLAAEGVLWCGALAALLAAVAHVRGRRRWAAAGSAALLVAACSTPNLGARTQTVAMHATFDHASFGAGPVVFTDAGGHLLEERRYEPFGAPVDARIATATGYVVQAPDFVARDLNGLAKRTDATTGWSDHGARWLAPETARWVSPDPPVEGPNAKFMFEPWALHPYQYVEQNPVAYWDPDGKEPAEHEDSPREEVAEGLTMFVPGYHQIPALKWAVSPLQSKHLGTGWKVGYAIISPPIIFVAGTLGELEGIAVGSYHLVKGTFRGIGNKIWPSVPVTYPKITLHPNAEEVTMRTSGVAQDDAPPPPPKRRPGPRHAPSRMAPRNAPPPPPMRTDVDCHTRGRWTP